MKSVFIIASMLICGVAIAQDKSTSYKKSTSAKVPQITTAAVSGDIKDLPQQTIVLEQLRANDIVTIADSTRSDANGHFEMTVKIKEPQLYRLHFNGNKFIFLSLHNEHVKLTGNWNDLDNYVTTGSKATEELGKFVVAFRDSVQALNKLAMVMDSLKKSGKEDLWVADDKNFEQGKARFTEFIKATADKTSYEPTAILAARLLNPGTDGEFLAAFNKKLGQKFPGTDMTKDFSEFYEKATKKNSIPQVGDMAPDVSLSTPDGKTVSLSSFKGHYVLLDFWASWCGPCRGENPNVVIAYNKYKDRNFTIYGVSLDSNKDPWQKAITADGLNWTQVSDLKGWSSSVAALYGVQSIPQNFLIDPSGKIIAHNLRGPALEETLETTLKSTN